MIHAAVHLDFETRGSVDLTKAGLFRYAEHPDTGVILFRYRFDDGPLEAWRMGTPVPAALVEHIRQGRRVIAHNAAFERVMWNLSLRAAYPYLPELTIEQMDCTMARAAAVAIPQSLAHCAEALSVPFQKDMEGRSLMLKMCKPTGFTEACRPIWKEDAPSIVRLGDYCAVDVEVEHAADGVLPRLSERERRVWELDQRINERGFPVDTKTVGKALLCVQEAKRGAGEEMFRLTGGAVTSPAQYRRMQDWISARGIPCDSVAKGEIEDLITTAFVMGDEPVEQVLRLLEATSVTFKFEALLNQVCADGYVRGSLAYHGTLNGRWAGRGVQPHNFKRLDTKKDAQTARICVELLQLPMTPAETIKAIEMICGSPLVALSLCARSMIMAKRGNRLIGGDLANIEGRFNAWLAGEAWKLEAFRAYDAGVGPDLYCVMASNILGRTVTKKDNEDRQLWGKVPELACGYQGGVPAFNKMGAKYGVRVPEATSRRIVDAWRDANPNIKAMWRELNDAAIDAVAHPGVVVPCCRGRVSYVMANGFLWCKLPSSRVIAYPKPKLRWKTTTITGQDGEKFDINGWAVTFWGERKGYREIDLYGGMQTAHVVSGASRDILVDGMFRLEAAGYPLCLTVHDEDLCEVAENFGSTEEFARLMVGDDEDWHVGLPLAAKAWEDSRYVK